MRKKWLESESRCKELENKLSIEKSMCQRKINELKYDFLIHINNLIIYLSNQIYFKDRHRNTLRKATPGRE